MFTPVDFLRALWRDLIGADHARQQLDIALTHFTRVLGERDAYEVELRAAEMRVAELETENRRLRTAAAMRPRDLHVQN